MDSETTIDDDVDSDCLIESDFESIINPVTSVKSLAPLIVTVVLSPLESVSSNALPPTFVGRYPEGVSKLTVYVSPSVNPVNS
uniref:hypothetical protein n=1 Tax=Streptococcus uberis TaxID=1349 RepID=UPI0027DC339F|nr:hypothetical protein [Streptococcus uberis]